MQEQVPCEPSSPGAAPAAGAGMRSREGLCCTRCAELGVARRSSCSWGHRMSDLQSHSDFCVLNGPGRGWGRLAARTEISHCQLGCVVMHFGISRVPEITKIAPGRRCSGEVVLQQVTSAHPSNYAQSKSVLPSKGCDLLILSVRDRETAMTFKGKTQQGKIKQERK